MFCTITNRYIVRQKLLKGLTVILVQNLNRWKHAGTNRKTFRTAPGTFLGMEHYYSGIFLITRTCYQRNPFIARKKKSERNPGHIPLLLLQIFVEKAWSTAEHFSSPILIECITSGYADVSPDNA